MDNAVKKPKAVYGKRTGTNKTYTGLEPLEERELPVVDPENVRGLSTEEIQHSFGVSTGGKPHEISVNNQKFYDAFGALSLDTSGEKVIYLTFDCGYEYTTKINGKDVRVTEWILDTLKEKNVKAVFFVTMYYCTENPDLVQRMIDEGHAVGNHSNNHPDMTTISIDKAVYEVMSLHEYVEENFGYEMTLFRPPTGNFSARSLAIVQSLGYKNVHWSFAYTDWYTDNQPNPADALNTVTSKAHSGAIYLLHAVSVTNATILGDAIDAFIDKGFELALFQ
jgi:peptidoglycan-N-acetylmuramic acid deacetylase